MKLIEFTIPGRPVPKGRPRATARGGFATMYTPKTTKDFEALVGALGRDALNGSGPFPADCPLMLCIEETVKRSKADHKSVTKSNPDGLPRQLCFTSKSDLDNVAKSIADGLQIGGVIANDSQIAVLIALRFLPALSDLNEASTIVRLSSVDPFSYPVFL